MQKVKKNLTLSALGFGILLLSACAVKEELKPVTPVEIRTVAVKRPAPIVPKVDQLKLASVNWIIITPENVEAKFAEISKGDKVLFALTSKGYENIGTNLSDIRALLEQQKLIIAAYEKSYR